MKTLTKENVNFEIEVLDEHYPIQKALSFNETGADHSEYIRKVENDNGANPWLWCTVRVTARFKGLEGHAYLGGCAYENEADFKKGGYYEQMQTEALEAIQLQLVDILEELNQPQTNPAPATGHTPGPWKSVQINSKLQVWDNDENVICQIHNIAPSENEANARLIASAPELLEALKTIQSVLNGWNTEGKYINLIEHAKSAIQKAEGAK